MDKNTKLFMCIGIVGIVGIIIYMLSQKNYGENFNSMNTYSNSNSNSNSTNMNSTINMLNKLQASVDMLCIKTRGRSVNLNTASFYEHHTFLNLTVDFLQKSSYDIAERVKSLGGICNYSLSAINNLSLIDDATKLLVRPKDIYQSLLPDYQVIIEYGQAIFKKSGPIGDAGTIALITNLVNKLEHFAWEINVMAGK
jgi:starvation-inducible DNA-binding protein